MDSKHNTWQDIAIGIAVLAGVLAVLILFFGAVVWLLRQLESQVAAAITAATVTAVASVTAIMVSKVQERRIRVAQEIRDKKTPVYEQLIEMLFKVMFADKAGVKKPSEKEIQRFFVAMTPKLILWGSQDVIRAWNRIRYHDWENSTGIAVLDPFDELMIAIRKDVGNDVATLQRRELMKLFINDLQSIDHIGTTVQ